MKINAHEINDIKIAEVISTDILIREIDDAVDLIGNLSYQGFDKMILHERHIIPRFFHLKNKLAGEILQKFTQYQMPLAIVGDFAKFNSKSLNDFINESTKGKHVNFALPPQRLYICFRGDKQL